MTIAERLAVARSSIQRFTPEELTRSRVETDFTVIDLRCREERRATGVIPGSIAVARSTLEWRCDPTSEWHDPRVARPERPTILVCAHGFSSALAAVSLADLGFTRVGDIVGGMQAWIERGLPLADESLQPEA